MKLSGVHAEKIVHLSRKDENPLDAAIFTTIARRASLPAVV